MNSKTLAAHSQTSKTLQQFTKSLRQLQRLDPQPHQQVLMTLLARYQSVLWGEREVRDITQTADHVAQDLIGLDWLDHLEDCVAGCQQAIAQIDVSEVNRNGDCLEQCAEGLGKDRVKRIEKKWGPIR